MEDGEDHQRHWPSFELVTYSEPTGVPHGWDEELVKKGAPKRLFRLYRAAAALQLVDLPGYGPLVRFGSWALYGSVCLDPHTGAVVSYLDGINGTLRLINSSLDRFIASVRAVIDRFPYDSNDDDLDRLDTEWSQAADDMETTLRAIDSAAVEDRDGFWMTFLDDVKIGDFSVEIILKILSRG